MLLGSTIVLRRKFDPETCLQTLVEEECDSLVVIPVMLQRMLALEPEHLEGIDLSRVQVVASSGSALPATLAEAWMDRFGDNLYNIYGSTEVAYASIATPEDLRADPTSAGKPPYGTVVKILDEAGNELPRGETGRIFVGNGLLFEGYTSGGSKEVVEGLMSSGDLGWFDEAGRLHVAGRDDDMIVSGGENVFPQEVEDVAAIGVDDDEYGKRLRAFVVTNGDAEEADLKSHVKENLAGYKVPREIVFLDELPRNGTGKVLKRELAGWDTRDDQKDGEGPA
jgi:fatty-acyl-CoA synthase